jgi:hypothetical protein
LRIAGLSIAVGTIEGAASMMRVLALVELRPFWSVANSGKVQS